MPPVSEAQFAFLLQLYQIELVLHCPWKADQGGFEPLTSKHRPLDLPKSTKISKIQNPKSPKSKIQYPQDPKSKIPQIQNPKSPKSKIQNPPDPKSKIPRIQNPKSPNFGFWGFWILDRYVANLYVRPPTPQILDFGGRFWILGLLGILDFGSWGFRILDFGFWGFWILDFGDFGVWILGILDFGAEIQNPKSPIQNPKSKLFWPILGILDFGFWTVM